MGFVSLKIKFPCGLEIEEDISSFGMTIGGLEELKDIICPLHGKNCKKNK